MTGGDSNWSGARGPASEGTPNTEPTSAPTPQDGFDTQQIHALARHPPPGTSVYSPSAAVSSALNPRSCVTCRRRKVRCDKHMPCSNCRRAQIPCIFPAPGRAPRRPRPKDPNAPSKQPSSERELELMKRLRKLEGIVEELSGQIEIETVRQPSSAGNSPEGPPPREIDENMAVRRHETAPSVSGSSQGQDSPATGAGMSTARQLGPAIPGNGANFGPLRKTSDVHRQFGRLVLNDKGVTRYVTSGFWSAVNDELDEIRRETRDYTDDESDESELEASPESADQGKGVIDHQSFILGYRSADVDLRQLHPLPSQIPFMWQVFQENIDPILKVLHVPSMSKLIRDLRNNLDSLTPSTEALMFSIYYAAITSLDEDEVTLNFGAEKDVLLKQYRFALEQALAKSNFLTTPDLTIAQAFLLFLVLVRRHDDSRFAWTLTGLLVRISQALGLHRDGTHFPSLSPFEIEMRRRIFWGVCVLDLRSAEDQGTDLMIMDRMFDTQRPLNINDTDFSPECVEFPLAREGPTDMTFSLIRFEICTVARRMHAASSDMAVACAREDATTLEEREELLSTVQQRVEDKYLKDNAEDNPMYWTAANVSRLVVAKMRLIIYQSVLFPGPGNQDLSEDKRVRLFNAATEIFEYSYLLNTDPRSKQWRWLFQTYTQLHAVAYVLIEVSHRPWSATVERSWAALNMVFSGSKPSLPQFDLEKMAGHSAVWLPLRKMYLKAKRHREAEIARLQADPLAAQQLELEDRAKSSPESFGALSSSIKGTIAIERWRKLVNAPPLPPDIVVPTPSQPRQNHTPSKIKVGAQQEDLESRDIRPDLMDYLDSAMANPHFLPTDLGPLWGREASSMLNQSTFGIATASMPRMDSMVGFGALPMGSGGAATPDQHQTQGNVPITSPLKDHRNLPPWMWPDTGVSDSFQMPNLPMGEMDVNMDEGFDWQGWQESLGRFELEANGGAGSGAWGPGI